MRIIQLRIIYSFLRKTSMIVPSGMASIYRRMLTFEGCSFGERTKRFCSFLSCKRKGTKECTTPKAPFKGGCNRSSCRSYISVSWAHQRSRLVFIDYAGRWSIKRWSIWVR